MSSLPEPVHSSPVRKDTERRHLYPASCSRVTDHVCLRQGRSWCANHGGVHLLTPVLGGDTEDRDVKGARMLFPTTPVAEPIGVLAGARARRTSHSRQAPATAKDVTSSPATTGPVACMRASAQAWTTPKSNGQATVTAGRPYGKLV